MILCVQYYFIAIVYDVHIMFEHCYLILLEAILFPVQKSINVVCRVWVW